MVRRSADGGLTWTTADNLPLQGATASIGITVTPSGSVIAVETPPLCGPFAAAPTAGTPGTTVDKFELGNYMSVAKGITADANGNLYVTGSAGKGHWITRKSTTGGISWTTVDDFTLNGSGIGMGVAVDEFGRVFVGGSSSGSSPRWIVRTSSDAGATWVTTTITGSLRRAITRARKQWPATLGATCLWWAELGMPQALPTPSSAS